MRALRGLLDHSKRWRLASACAAVIGLAALSGCSPGRDYTDDNEQILSELRLPGIILSTETQRYEGKGVGYRTTIRVRVRPDVASPSESLLSDLEERRWRCRRSGNGPNPSLTDGERSVPVYVCERGTGVVEVSTYLDHQSDEQIMEVTADADMHEPED